MMLSLSSKTYNSNIKHINKIALGSICGVFTIAGATMIGSTCSTQSASAATQTGTSSMNVALGSVISITAPASLDVSMTPTTSGTLSKASGQIKVSTNNVTGYKLTMGMVSGATSTALINSYQPSGTQTYTIPTLSASTSVSSFPTNRWGYSTENPSSITTYKPAPAVGSTTTLTTTTAPATANTTNFTLGVKADTSLASGSYSNQVSFTAVTNTVGE